MRLLRPLVLAAATSLVLAGGAQGAVVDAGALQAHTGRGAWSLTFVDRAGRPVLTEAAGIADRPTGRLGFRTPAGWFHATRVVSESLRANTYNATLATNDPAGRRLAVRLARDADGVVALTARVAGTDTTDVAQTGIAFGAHSGERYLGFGERSNAVDQRGNDVENYVAEGPFEPDERSLVPLFVPSWGFHPRDDATYFPMPWLLSTAGYGVLLDSPETSLFRLGTDASRSWSAEVSAPELRLRVFAGPRPADVLRRLTARIGRQPAPPAPFTFGPWYQPKDSEQETLSALHKADVPLSVAQTYTHYLPCESQTGHEDAERSRVARLHAEGLAVTTYFNPMICTGHTRFADAAAAGALVRDQQGGPGVYRYSTLTRFDVSQFDFTSPAGRTFYGRLLGEAVADGHDGWMEDFGEYTPLDAHVQSGMSGTALHNLYPTQYHCAARQAAARSLRFVRSGWTGTARCAPVVWGGDPSTDWGFDGLASVVTEGLTMGLSGVSTWGSDIGGFFSLFENKLTPELLIRWLELGAVSGVMRTEADGIRIPASARPQIWDAGVLPVWRRWAKLRTQLYPYLVAADREYRRSGLPIMRHLALAFPGDARAAAVDDAFLFGDDLLAAPVLKQGARTRTVYLPRGRWVDLWRSTRYRAADGGLSLRRARVLSGGRKVTLPAPLRELPLLARAGTLLPLLPPDVDTLAAYGDRAAVTSLNERASERTLLAWPRGRSSAGLEDGTVHSRETRSGWELTISAKRSRRWSVHASLSALDHPMSICHLSARGGRVRSWRYDRATRVLHAVFTARRGTLVARRCA